MSRHVGKEMELNIEGQTYQVKVKELTDTLARVTVNGKDMEIQIKLSGSAMPVPQAPVQASAPVPSPSATHTQAAPATSAAPAPAGKDALNALMPGLVVRILVSEGQEVSAGEVLLVLEAMKMENEIRSDRAGKIAKVHVAVGQQVQTGDPLVSF